LDITKVSSGLKAIFFMPDIINSNPARSSLFCLVDGYCCKWN